MEEAMPDTFEELDGYRAKLEGHYRDMQDMEFTIQKGKLWMLQTRSGKRTVKAALKCAVDMCGERLDYQEVAAVARIDPASFSIAASGKIVFSAPDARPRRSPEDIDTFFDHAACPHASPGAAAGKIVFSAAAAEAGVGNGQERAHHPRPHRDQPGRHRRYARCRGHFDHAGGMTSHAAVVARGMGQVLRFRRRRFEDRP